MLPPSLMALFPNTGWYLLYLYMCLYLNDSFYILFRSFVPDAGTLYDGHKDEMQRIWRKKTFTQNKNNHTKDITFSMCPPLRFWRQLWEFRRYFSFVSLLTHSKDTTVKTIYCLWANGARLTLRWNGTSLLRKCEKIVT